MKIQKKDGTLEDYNRQKIIVACSKAAKRATFYEGGADAKERMRILESSGMKQDLDESVESANASFQKKLDELGYI